MQIYNNWIIENQQAVSTLLEEELDYWLSQVDGDETQHNTLPDGISHTTTIKVPLDQNFSNTDLQNSTIAALLFSLHRVTDESAFIIFREGHGRNTLMKYDVSDAIGWFTCKYPTRYNIVPDSLQRTLDAVIESNNAVPNGGVGFDVLKYFGPVYINRQLECSSGILFNYLGDLTFTTNINTDEVNDRLILSAHSGFSSTMENSGTPEGNSLFKLNVNAWIENNVLHCSLDIASTLGLDAEKCYRFVELIQHHLNKLLLNGQVISKGKVTPFQRGLISYVFNHPESHSYINQNSFETGTDIPYNFFREVCSILTTKYEILRTCYDFDYETGNFISTLLPPGTINCEYYEVSEKDTFNEVNHLLKNIKQKGFNINREPLIRFSLIKAGDEKSIIVITSHHIIIDGTSVMYILKELLTIASDLREGREIVTSIPTALKFSTYTNWINAKDEEESFNYWKNLLADTSPCLLEDKTAGESGAIENQFADAEHHFNIHPAAAVILKSQHITLAAALNYLVGFVMSRYNGKDSFVWGNTVTVRPFELDDMETIVGPCIATIPVKMNFDSDSNIFDAIKSLQIQLLESQEYAYVALNDIYRSSGHSQLFSVTYVYQNFIKSGFDEQQSDSYQTHLTHDSNISSHFPVNILVFEGDGQLAIRVKYRNDLFTGYLIKDICHALGKLFNNLDTIKDLPVRDIDIFKVCELKSSWLQGEDVNLSGVTLHHAFTEAARQYPHKTAVIDINNSVSYHALNGMSNRICELLTDHKISGAVGIRMKRSVNLIAVIIGILKSGCHIVSLEHDFPEEKIEWIHQNIGLSAVFTDEADSLKINSSVFIVGTIEPLDEYADLPVIAPSALCCINYTSGSTGVPKLVKINHAGHVNRILWLKKSFPATDKDVYGFKTLLCFGPSLREVFEPLMQGSTLFVYSNESNNNPALFHEQTRRYNVTRLFLTPTFIRLLHDFELQDALSALKYLEISGEPIAIELFDRLRTAFPSIKIVGRYGATEAPGTVYYTQDSYSSNRNLPLGKPIQNTGVMVLNEQGNILPAGVIGEIAISGESISTGYINKELEIGNFIDVAGRSHVKTGDLGYVNNDGILVFQSRKTRMIKIRGFRVEPAEIEFNLAQHPDIIKAVVIPVVSKNNTRLTAFYIKKDLGEAHGLRSFLEKRLPPYMIPHEFVEITKVPLTDSGKVDYVNLSKQAGANIKGTLRPPAPGIEKDVFEIISDLIDHREFDILSNLLEIGMDSILALKTIYRIRKLYDVNVVVTDIYMYPTIKDLSAFLIKKMNHEPAADDPYYFINYNENNEFLFFVPPIGNNQIDLKMLESGVPEHITLVIFRSVNAKDAKHLSLEKIASDYIELIRKINKNKKVHISGWSLGATIAYEMAAQLEKAGIPTGALLLFDPGFYTPEYDMNMSKNKLEDILKKLTASDGQIDAEVKEQILTDMLNANKLIVNYKPSVYNGKVQLLKPTDISAEERNYNRALNGMEPYCKGEIEVIRLAGNHMTMLNNIQHNKQIIEKFI